ncbi:DUF262 domain-containing protein [Stenotrophomonas sp. TWI1151]|uniref:DUF262 domain-containing protein n=1 Tax=Stenotrophomonas sp. TWI1151 TaxID=3136798 RepID=UPI00320B1C4F
MYLKPADPDLQTLYQRIANGDLDLQPEFQRGEVWSDQKRQRLIDSILRDWQIPPVHVVIDPDTNAQSVLDGQQRLAAIRDFFQGTLRVNGNIEPFDRRLEVLDGLTFLQLPQDVRRRLERYSIRVFYISDYLPEEPGELFFRLNQNSSLSPAEQRNAFFGKARRQVKKFVEMIEGSDIQSAYFGFTNARMAYDDIVARSLLLLEAGSLSQKLTSAQLVDRYRSPEGFSRESRSWLQDGLSLLALSATFLPVQIRLNKATALTWLVFASRVTRYSRNVDAKFFAKFLRHFESRRLERRDSQIDEDWSLRALAVYDDRASARVGDVSSVVLRDFVLWLHFAEYGGVVESAVSNSFASSEFARYVLQKAKSGIDVERIAIEVSWGSVL